IKIALITVFAITALIIAAVIISCTWRSSPEDIIVYENDNPYIADVSVPQVSAHRSGSGIAPEETLTAFKYCAENSDFSVDIFEFDLHITKDNVLVLLHDDTLDRTSDSEKIFGKKDVYPQDYTYEELRRLNMGAKFENEKGETPYADLHGEQVPEELKILRVEDALDYLTSISPDFDYIIEIKNGGEEGKKGVDILYEILKERNLLNDTVFGTFHEEVSLYVDEHYPDMARSATIKEVLSFYKAAITDDKDFNPKYIALQIPYNMPYRLIANLGTATVINYAHKNNIAVQYWTINNENDLEYLSSVGADCIMTDYPDKLYNITDSDS
ncbi:MAG: hypothetical protein LUG21_01715, partial [Clostridiales bacterium]|nr:hypothetical protein [Clostridiales bacterium]